MNRRINNSARRARNQRRIAFMELGGKTDKPALPHPSCAHPQDHYKPKQSEQ
ncbi:MAG: hypothetical protein OXT49_05560 [Gammaproteobacteria bacterium]|nr:hypothetical protein [Gammaproteobacteria bacterium]